MTCSCTWNRGLLAIRHDGRFVQLNVGKGWDGSRVRWWPRHGSISVRITGYWWLSLNWKV